MTSEVNSLTRGETRRVFISSPTALSLLVFHKEMLFKSLVSIHLSQKGHIAHKHIVHICLEYNLNESLFSNIKALTCWIMRTDKS